MNVFETRINGKEILRNIQKAINLVPNEPYYKKQLWKFKNTKYKIAEIILQEIAKLPCFDKILI